MAITVRHYGDGFYGVVTCDMGWCPRRLSVSGDGVGECVREAMTLCEARGWRLAGDAYCPMHRPFDPPGASRTVGDGFSWIRVDR
jgi:hypothetical protein